MRTLDLLLLAAYLAAVVAVGAWMTRRSRSAVDYMLGGRDLPWWLILVSIVATETSTVTFLSIPGFAYARDLTWLQIAFGFVLGRLAVSALLLPGYFAGRIFTAYELLERRFGPATRRAASALFVATRTVADGLRLFLTALVLREMTGLGIAACVAAIGAVTVLYTTSGGMRAVQWTDFLQFTVYVAGAVVALLWLVRQLPAGWSTVYALAAAEGKLRFIDLRLDLSEPYALWPGVIGGAFLALGSHGVDQMMVQRYLCARSLRDARRALSWSGVLVLVQFALFLVIGLALYAFYRQSPPQVPFTQPDQVFAHFIVHHLPAGMVGLLVGAVFAAAMSTLSSSLNSCATTLVRDLVPALAGRSRDGVPPEGRGAADRRELRAVRAATVLFGALQVVVGLAAQRLTGSVISAVLGIAALTTGLVLGLFALGALRRRASERAALVGLAAGGAAMLAIFARTPLAFPWFALLGAAITFGVGWVAAALPQGGRAG